MPFVEPHKSFRQTLQFYLIDCQTLLGRLLDCVIIALNVAICLITVVETYPIGNAARSFLWKFEIVVVAFFILEYAARVYAAPNRWKQVRDIYSIIDLVAILPTLPLLVLPLFGIELDLGFIQMIRGFRIFRIFRFLRFTADPDFFFGRITMQLLKVVRLVFTIVMIFFISAGLFYLVEHGINDHVRNFGDAFYFTVVALTTVGFGDITPQSQGGKWITVLMIISGIILIPWQAARIVKEWIYMAQKVDVVCTSCGLRYHDKDASHCKSCGHVIYQVYESD
jgi:voltage-gated potassium channel